MTTRRIRGDFRRRAAALLDQQLWCWGRDIARPEGNLLLELGVCRHRLTESQPGSTAYTGRVGGESVVWLWGFGLAYCHPELGGLFLRRYRFDPMLMSLLPKQPAHAPEQLGPLMRPTTARQRATAGELLRAAIEWIARYEHWIAETFGIAYRETTPAVRYKPPVVPAGNVARAWDNLAKKSARLTNPISPRRGPWEKLLVTLRTTAEGPKSVRRRGPIATNVPRRFRIQ